MLAGVAGGSEGGRGGSGAKVASSGVRITWIDRVALAAMARTSATPVQFRERVRAYSPAACVGMADLSADQADGVVVPTEMSEIGIMALAGAVAVVSVVVFLVRGQRAGKVRASGLGVELEAEVAHQDGHEKRPAHRDDHERRPAHRVSLEDVRVGRTGRISSSGSVNIVKSDFGVDLKVENVAEVHDEREG